MLRGYGCEEGRQGVL